MSSFSKTSLVRLFCTLTRKEVAEFQKFIESPFFNERLEVIRLFEYLLKVKQNSGTKKEAFQYVFPNASYKDSQLRYTISNLYQALKKYLALKEWEESELSYAVDLTKSLRKHGEENVFEKEWRKIKKEFDNYTKRDSTFHYQQYQLLLEHHTLFQSKQRKQDVNLQLIADELSTFYLAAILRLKCFMLSHQSFSTRAFQIPLFDEVISKIEEGNYLEYPVIRIYYFSYKAFTAEDGELFFQRLLNTMNQALDYFPGEEARNIILLAINYCIRQRNSGKKKFNKEALKLYQFGIDNETLMMDGYLSRFTYNNIVILAILSQEMNWASTFLETYKDRLNPKERSNTYLYNRAIYLFHLPDYDKAMELLHRVHFKDILYELNARKMLIQIYYELNEFDALDSLLDSYKIFIIRKKDLGYHKNYYLKFITFVRRLLNTNLADQEKNDEIRIQINSTRNVAEKKWLLTQLKKWPSRGKTTN